MKTRAGYLVAAVLMTAVVMLAALFPAAAFPSTAAASQPAAFPPAAAALLVNEPAGWEARDLPSDLEPACSGLTGVWGSSAADVYAVSSCGRLLHCDGQAWSLRDPGPLAAAGLEYDSSIRAIWGAPSFGLCIAGSERGEEAGPRSAVYHYDDDGRWAIYPLEAGDSAAINGLWGASASDVYAVGGDDVMGCIFHWDGAAWTPSTDDTGDALLDIQLQGVWGSSGSDVFAVGGGISTDGMGLVLHHDGSGWLPMDIGPVGNLRGVWGSSAADVFAVGLGGAILHYDGSDWTTQEGAAGADLCAVWGSSASDVFAAGYDAAAGTAIILRYDGSTWSAMAGVNGPEALRGLWGSSAADVWSVGDAGAVLHYAGPQPQPEPGPQPEPAAPADPSPAPPGNDPQGDADASPRPIIAGLDGDSGRPGEDLTVTISGSHLGGATAVDFGAGITVVGLSVVSENELSASITIDPNAGGGRRTISVTTPQGTATSPGGFAVQGPASRVRLWVYIAAAAGAAAAVAALALLASGRIFRTAR